MSAPERVDVLAVLDAILADPDVRSKHALPLYDVRAAVAELVEAAEYAQDCLRRALEIDMPECTCESCQECGAQPNDCSRTKCAQTCQCSLCDHCCAKGAADATSAALARFGDAR